MDLALVLKYFISIILSKKSYILGSLIISSSVTFITTKFDIFGKIYEHIEDKEGIVPLITFLMILVLSYIFIIIDFITGVTASKREGHKMKSRKWASTINKFFGLFLYSCLASVIILLLANNYFVLTMLFAPVILTVLKEYISIGENLERISGKKSYMFTLIDKVFDILEMKFFKSLKDKKIDTPPKEKMYKEDFCDEKDNHPPLGN